MRIIYKYKLKLTEKQFIIIPQYAKFLSVQVQHRDIYIWALVDTTNPPIQYKINIKGTGHPISNNEITYEQFLGTIQQDDLFGTYL